MRVKLNNRKSLINKKRLKNIKVYATTVLRSSNNHLMTGYLIEIIWSENKVNKKIPIPLKSNHPFWNARGGNRGGRGIAVYKNNVYVATAFSILKYDENLNYIGEITNPCLGGLHEIFINDDEGIWVTSTIFDLILKIDFNGKTIREWWGSESKLLQNILSFEGRGINLKEITSKKNFNINYKRYSEDEILHLNSVWAFKDKVYTLSNQKKAFIKIFPKPEEMILRDNELQSPHNGIIISDDQIMINDTQNQKLKTYNLTSGRLEKTIDTVMYKGEDHPNQFATPGWQRGLVHVTGSIYLVGTSPATIFEIDIDSGKKGQICVIDGDVKHCVHGLTISS